MTTLVWFRNDLRVSDHPALHAACQSATQVEAVFVVTRTQWQRHDMSMIRERFVYESVHELTRQLAALNIPLHILNADTFAATPAALAGLCVERSVRAVHFNDEHEWNEQVRDATVQSLLMQQGISVVRHEDQCLLRPGTVTTQQGGAFRVYTPFRRACVAQLSSRQSDPLPAPSPRAPHDIVSHRSTWQPAEARGQSLWPGGEPEAHRRLDAFVDTRIASYKAQRDFPAVDGTSTLSPWLAVGAVSIRQCLHAARLAGEGSLEPSNPGIACWINELLWREFYRHLMVAFPHVCKHRAFVADTDMIPWRGRGPLFDAWCEARTGYPIVDAAMRQLLETGWMHNRLRMVTAMFLTKHLFTDWRLGEAFFMQHLIDGDLASNNGGWQWSASTGADAAPYFRVFNPTLQSQRFDGDAQFLRTWLPELRTLDARAIHVPGPMVAASLGYPAPVVDHRMATDEVKRHFAQLAAMRNHNA